MRASHTHIAHELYRVVAEHKILFREYRAYKCVRRRGQFRPTVGDARFFHRYLMYGKPHVSAYDMFPDQFRRAMAALRRAQHPDAAELYYNARIPLPQVCREMQHLSRSRALTSADRVAIARHNQRRLGVMEDCLRWIRDTGLQAHYNWFYRMTQL